ncbi:MAG: hypothetical protein ACRDUA_25010, partial [Micromonosporaceae bacterium]
MTAAIATTKTRSNGSCGWWWWATAPDDPAGRPDEAGGKLAVDSYRPDGRVDARGSPSPPRPRHPTTCPGGEPNGSSVVYNVPLLRPAGDVRSAPCSATGPDRDLDQLYNV